MAQINLNVHLKNDLNSEETYSMKGQSIIRDVRP